jgi:hypothetical protein
MAPHCTAVLSLPYCVPILRTTHATRRLAPPTVPHHGLPSAFPALHLPGLIHIERTECVCVPQPTCAPVQFSPSTTGTVAIQPSHTAPLLVYLGCLLSTARQHRAAERPSQRWVVARPHPGHRHFAMHAAAGAATCPALHPFVGLLLPRRRSSRPLTAADRAFR